VSSTRERILGTAREITEQQGAVPSMSALARAVGISRQALYLHFPDRTQLLLAFVAYHEDRDQLLQVARAAVQQAADAAGAIRARARIQASRFPAITVVSRALDGARHTDPAAAAAWADRTGSRMSEAISIIERLRAEGRLDPTWATAEAAALLWELTSFRVWDDLVNGAQIEPDRYVEIITTAALSTLGSPVTQSSPRNTESASRIN
jgi:AcrR family transcriptional regulator